MGERVSNPKFRSPPLFSALVILINVVSAGSLRISEDLLPFSYTVKSVHYI